MKTVLILSGGMDSATLLWYLRDRGDDVRCLSIDYGQRHRRELECAKELCTIIGVEHRVADLTALRPFLAGSSQTDNAVAVPHGHYAAENMKLTVVPFRNGLMLSVAAAWAISTRSDAIIYGAHAGDHAIYPDCRPEFVAAFGSAVKLGDWHQVNLMSPFIDLTKAKIVALGARLHVPWEKTYSCYQGDMVHCGRCGTCCERLMAFAEAGVQDGVAYLDTDYYKTL